MLFYYHYFYYNHIYNLRFLVESCEETPSLMWIPVLGESKLIFFNNFQKHGAFISVKKPVFFYCYVTTYKFMSQRSMTFIDFYVTTSHDVS